MTQSYFSFVLSFMFASVNIQSTTSSCSFVSVHVFLSSSWFFYLICTNFYPKKKNNNTDNRAGPSNLGNVISQILLCKQITPDFNQEELCSIAKDSQDIAQILSEMQEFMPRQETVLGMYFTLF